MVRPRILVADDDKDVREMLSEFLRHAYEIETAGDGMEALSAVMTAEKKTDLAIVDLNMPGIDGIELVASLPEDTPVIVISGYLDSPDLGGRLKDLQPVAVFEKPFSLAGLEQAIRSALN